MLSRFLLLCSPNSLPVLTGVTGTGSSARGVYSCQTWNTADVRVGAIEIASKCANACEVLQWYMSWCVGAAVPARVKVQLPGAQCVLACSCARAR
jgi:hypothetical protein